MTLICIVNIIAGLIIAGISLPLILGKVPPNPLYGFRTPRTLSNPAVWYPANAYAGRWLLGSGLIIAIAAIGLYLAPDISLNVYAYAILTVTLLTIGVSVVQCFRFLNRLAPK